MPINSISTAPRPTTNNEVKTLKYFGILWLLAVVGGYTIDQIMLFFGVSTMWDNMIWGIFLGVSWDDIADRLAIERP